MLLDVIAVIIGVSYTLRRLGLERAIEAQDAESRSAGIAPEFLEENEQAPGPVTTGAPAGSALKVPMGMHSGLAARVHAHWQAQLSAYRLGANVCFAKVVLGTILLFALSRLGVAHEIWARVAVALVDLGWLVGLAAAMLKGARARRALSREPLVTT